MYCAGRTVSPYFVSSAIAVDRLVMTGVPQS